MEWFAASWPGASPEEDLDGIRLIRRGSQWTVHMAALRHYRGKLRGHFDVLIDQVNTVPFFTPLWADIPAFMFIHQLAREVWWYESPFPVNALGYLLEPFYLRVYRHTPVLTVSESTRQDLIRLGFKGPISIVPEGLEPITGCAIEKSRTPTFLYVGRLAPSKRPEAILSAFSRFRATIGAGRLWLVGSGEDTYVRRLVRLASSLGLAQDVTFFGHVTIEKKHALMHEAYALILASAREGWGLSVTEANACRTPAIAYDVPGLRDSIKHGETGLLVFPSPASLAEAMVQLWSDPSLYEQLANAAAKFSSGFTFEKSAQAFEAELDRGRLEAS